MTLLIPILLGLVAGLFVDYLSDVIPVNKLFSIPVCNFCESPRKPSDYLQFKRCPKCNQPRHYRTFLVLASLVALSILLWFMPPHQFNYLWGLILLSYLSLVFVIDTEHHLIFHKVSLVGAGLGLFTGFLVGHFVSAVLGGISGLIFMLIFYLLGIAYGKFKNRGRNIESGEEEALGFGDVTISGVLGMLMGFSGVFLGLMTGILFAGVFSLILIVVLLINKKFTPGNIYIPYGPFLILGSFFYIFFR